MRRFVDISVPLQAGIASDPPGHLPEIDYYDHKQTAAEVVSFFPGAKIADLPDGEGWAIERVRITTHNGTHVDAPYHYASTMDGGKRAITIDEVPLEWCLQPAVKLDFRHFPDGYVVTAADVEQELELIVHTLAPLEIVLVNTSACSTSRSVRMWSSSAFLCSWSSAQCSRCSMSAWVSVCEATSMRCGVRSSWVASWPTWPAKVALNISV